MITGGVASCGGLGGFYQSTQTGIITQGLAAVGIVKSPVVVPIVIASGLRFASVSAILYKKKAQKRIIEKEKQGLKEDILKMSKAFK